MTTAILSVKVTPVSAAGGARKTIGGFLRYIQHRDHHFDGEQVRDVDGLIRYVAFRDAASPEGRLFDAGGTVGAAERQSLTDHVARSLVGVESRWASGRDGRVRDQSLAVYRFVLSPADAHGLDLRHLTRATMAQLQQRVGERRMPPWIAAEHRNTDHPHVHIVMAARRQAGQGRYRELHLTRDRLASMKEAMWAELERQRGERTTGRGRTYEVLTRLNQPVLGGAAPTPARPRQVRRDQAFDPLKVRKRIAAPSGHAKAWERPVTRRRRRAKTLGRSVSTQLGALAAYYKREAIRAAEERLARGRDGRDKEEMEVQR